LVVAKQHCVKYTQCPALVNRKSLLDLELSSSVNHTVETRTVLVIADIAHYLSPLEM